MPRFAPAGAWAVLKAAVSFVLFALVFASPAAIAAAQGRGAVLAGTVLDERGVPMRGVEVSVSSEQLIGTERTTDSDETGAWRMAGLPPGLYLVVFTAEGRKPHMRNATLDPGQILTLDAVMEPGPATEVSAVVGDGPLLEGRNPSADAYIRDDLLALIPVSQRFGPEIIGLTPGFDGRTLSAYGTAGPGEQAWLVDRARVDHPRDGSPAIALAHPWLEAVRVTGLGADADAGSFTGVAAGRVLRAGSNRFRGSAGLLFEDGWMTSDNRPDSLRAGTPPYSAPALEHAVDLEVQAGGPIAEDRTWIFGGVQYSTSARKAAGFDSAPSLGAYPEPPMAPAHEDLSSPRVMAKPTVRLGPAATLAGSLIAQGLDREGLGAGAASSPAASLALDSSSQAWTIGYTRTFARTSLLELRYSGLRSDRSLTPYNGDTPGWYDPAFEYAAVNAPEAGEEDASRQTLSAAVTLFRNFGGEHGLTVGGEIATGHADATRRTPGDALILAPGGLPILELAWAGTSSDAHARTTSLFVEDRWLVAPRVTLTPGVRLDLHRGRVEPASDTVFSTSPWSPRLGAAWDVTGTSRTVVRGTLAIRHDALRTAFFERAGGEFAPLFITPLAGGGGPLLPPRLARPGGMLLVDDGISQPRVREAVAGMEHELLPNVFLSASVIWRTYDNFIDDVGNEPLDRYVTLVDPDPGPDGIDDSGDESGNAVTAYLQLPPYATNTYTITNPSGAERRYRAFQLAGRKRLSQGWQVQGSWVVSRLTGNYEPSADGAVTPAWDDPNRDPAFQPFLEGRLAADRTHLVSAVGSYSLPYGVLVSGAWRFASGAPYTRTAFRLLPTGPADLLYEPRGTQRTDRTSRVDVRAERLFELPEGDLALTIEGFNLTNSSAVLSRVSQSGPAYGQPRALAAPRTFRLGAAWRF